MNCLEKLLTPVLLCATVAPAAAQRNVRAWFRDGQTFLVWQHSQAQPPETYDVWAADAAFTDLTRARHVATVFSDNGHNVRLDKYVSGARWQLPAATKGSYQLAADESYFVATPHRAGQRWYAVTGGVPTTTVRSIGPIAERIEAIHPHLQYKDAFVSLWAHWIDGRDSLVGRGDYPVMGNASANGCGFNFAVWAPQRPLVPNQLGAPLLCTFHGWGGDLFDYAPVSPGKLGRTVSFTFEGLVATFDDALLSSVDATTRAPQPTFFFGYHEDYDRFHRTPPKQGERVPDYTVQRVLWELAWIQRNYPVHAARTSVTGLSMGGTASLYLSQQYPERFAGCLSHVPVFDLDKLSGVDVTPIFGRRDQKLVTTVAGNPLVYDLLDQGWRLSQPHPDWPYTRIFVGRHDTTTGWSHVPALFRAFNANATGSSLYWDQRKHAEWIGSQFLFATLGVGAPMNALNSDYSFPGFYNVDLDPNTPGLQPDPGTGTDSTGDAYGTWGGYLTWNPQSVLDRREFWEAQMRIRTRRMHPSEKCPVATVVTAVVPRRRRLFRPKPNTKLGFELRDQDSGKLLQSGIVVVAQSGEIAVPNLALTTATAVLRIFTSNERGRRPVSVGITQPAGPGSFRLHVDGLTPNSVYVNLLSLTPAPDGVGTGWAYGVALSPMELGLIGVGPPFVGLASSSGTAEFTLPANTLPPFVCEVFCFELSPEFGLGRNAGPYEFTLK